MSASPSPSAASGDDGPDVGAVRPDTDLRVPWIEPAWLVVPLVLVPLLVAGALLLPRRLVPPARRHRRR